MGRPSLFASNSKARRGQLAILGVIFGLVIFFILWALWLGGWINTVTTDFVTTNSLTGIEAFFITYLNLWIFVGIMLGSISIIYIGGRA